MEFNEKKIFSNLTENSKFTFYFQFFVLHNLRWNDGTSRRTSQSMCNKAKPTWAFKLNSGVSFVTTHPCYLFPLLSPTHINFTCNVLMFVIRYKIMLIASSGLHVPK